MSRRIIIETSQQSVERIEPSQLATVEIKRFYRYRDAPGYLGMDRHRFDSDVRPWLTEIPVGGQGIAFDRHELDAWADHYKKTRGRPPKKKPPWE